MRPIRTPKLLSIFCAIALLSLASCMSEPPIAGDDQQNRTAAWEGTEHQLKTTPGDSLIGRIAIAPNGSVLAVPGYSAGPMVGDTARRQDPYVAIFDIKTGELIRKIPGDLWPLEINKSGDLLLTQSRLELSIYDIATGSKVRTFGEDVRLATFMHDGERLLVQKLKGNEFTTIAFELYSARTGELIKSIETPARQVWQLTITPDDKHVMVKEDLCGDGYLYMWDLETGVKSPAYNVYTFSNRDAASMDGSIVSMLNWQDHKTEFRESRTGVLLSSVSRAENNYMPVDISNDHEHYAAIEFEDYTRFDVNVRRINDGALVKQVATVNDYILDMRFTPDGSILAVGLQNAGVILYRVK